MKGRILVTDTLFIFDEHVNQLEDAGYEVVRIEKPDMSEDELKEAVKGKVGYILGGIEYVTEPVIQAATDLKSNYIHWDWLQGAYSSLEACRRKRHQDRHNTIR